MQHKATVFTLTLAITAFTFLSSCNKYLDVQPEDRFLDETVFSNRNSIRNALNGIYLNLAKPALYGENLTSTTLDVIGQYYDVTVRYLHPFSETYQYNYNDASTKKYFSTIWENSYEAVLNLNLFIQRLEAENGILASDEKQLLLGEAYGLRGFLLFDQLRLFGPVYPTDSTKAAIPYPHDLKPDVRPLLPANQVMDSVLTDLSYAAALLEKDPVRTQGAHTAVAGEDVYFSLRNRRMNYFTVRALMARALLYRGNKTGAKAIAASVITESGKWFPWSPATSSAPGIPNPDRVFSSEVIFGVENISMYTTQQNWFAATHPEWEILMPASRRLNEMYDNNPNDYRNRSWFAIDPTSNRIDRIFQKYADVKAPNSPFRRLQPLVRISEMYYIAAECADDDNSAAALLNTVRTNRGLTPLTLNGDKQDQLTKEYQKEFWGEGQLFFYYKRTNQPAINNGAGNGMVPMGNAQYVVPLPLSETSFR